VLLFRASRALRCNLGHFADSSRNGVLRGALGSSLEGHFWCLESPILMSLAREAQKRETGSIRSEGDLRCGSEDLRDQKR